MGFFIFEEEKNKQLWRLNDALSVEKLYKKVECEIFTGQNGGYTSTYSQPPDALIAPTHSCTPNSHTEPADLISPKCAN